MRKHASEVVAGATLALLLTSCRLPVYQKKPPAPSVSRPLSDLRYNGTDAPYLLAINCDVQPERKFTNMLPALTPGQTIGDPWTVGDTTSQVARVNHDRSQTATFAGGATLRRLADGGVEFIDSDSQPGQTTTESGPARTWYTPLAGKKYYLVVEFANSGDPAQPDTVTVSCAKTNETNPVPTS